jgi:hypothetical protein
MLSTWEVGVLSQAFGLASHQVREDVGLIIPAHQPLDEVMASLRERHAWTAATAYRYIRTLHTAQRGGPISL